MATTTTQSNSNPTVDPYDHFQLVLNPDGSLTRKAENPTTPPTPDPTLPGTSVLSKDITYNQSHNTWLRIFLPRQAPDHNPPMPNKPKLPIIFYYHGGGFILFSAATTYFHVFCADMAAELPAIVLSVDYRLAPEHRLPAAYDDAMEALRWTGTNGLEDGWLRDHADFSNCFLMGTSAGANMAYHVGLRAATMIEDLEPLKIKGLILHDPFFGGTKRTPSELMRAVNDPLLRPGVTDMMWDLSLPIGADRDHEYCNLSVSVSVRRKLLKAIKAVGWKVLVTGFDRDPLYDFQVEAAKALEEEEVTVVTHFAEGGFHAADVFEPSLAKPLHGVLKSFLNA